MFGRRACCLPRGFVNRIARRLLPRGADCDAGICCASLKRRLPSRDARSGGDTDERLVRHPRGRPRAGIRGFDDRQVAVLLKVMRSSGESAVTKSDLALVKSELTRMDASLRREITATRTELRSSVAELRAEIASSAAELRGEIATAKAELRAGMNAMANKLLLSQLPVAGRERRLSCRRQRRFPAADLERRSSLSYPLPGGSGRRPQSGRFSCRRPGAAAFLPPTSGVDTRQVEEWRETRMGDKKVAPPSGRQDSRPSQRSTRKSPGPMGD